MANDLTIKRFLYILRNALAHGGVVYLDRDGSSRSGRTAHKYAFVSGVYARGSLSDLDILCVKESDFYAFLKAWVEMVTHDGAFIDQIYALQVPTSDVVSLED